MSITMPIENGQIPTMPSGEKQKTQSQENKDMFMQLLVAEMQYQDPLEPTDNSQYIQQLYSMSQTESVLEVQADVEEMTTKSLVGKYVSCFDKDTNKTIEGKVDSVTKMDDEWKISINGEVLSVNSIQMVHDSNYFEAVSAADKLDEMVKKLPDQDELRASHKENLQKAVDVYNNMDDYAKGFLSTGIEDKLKGLVSRMNALLKPAEETTNAAAEEETEATEKSEDKSEEAAEVAEEN